MATDDAGSEYFLLNVTGQIETAIFPTFDYIWCKYCYAFGTDWSITAGVEEGMTQTAIKSLDDRGIHVLNFPLDISFKASNVSGWPQLIVHAYGVDVFGNDVVRGYGAVHLPLQSGRHKRTISMFVPESSSPMIKAMGWLMSTRAEFCNPRVIAEGEGRDVTRVRSQGAVNLSFNVAMKNISRLGYTVSSSEVKGSSCMD